MQTELFFGLTNIAWTAISSIATSVAVITALFIPYVEKSRRRLNIFEIIENEIDRNITVINKAFNLEETYLSFTKAPIAVKKGFILQDLRTNYWDENKQYVSEFSAKKYNEYLQVNEIIMEIKGFSSQVLNAGQNDSSLNYIEIALERTYSQIRSLKKYRSRLVKSVKK
jgi:hypothetical protein